MRPRSTPKTGHAGLGRDLRPAAPRALREGRRELARIDVAVGREVRGTEHSLGRHRRKEPLRLLGRDQLERQAEGLGPAGLAAQLLHPLLGRGEAERSDLVPAGLEADLVAERPVEVDRGHHHARERERAAQLADEPRRVEGRAARQVRALAEHHVVPAELGQPVGDRATPDAASDHDRACPLPHAERRLETGLGGRAPQPLEVLIGVGHEVEVELRDRLLDDSPHRLPEVGHEAHERQRPRVGGAVGLEQRALAVLVERVVDREVRQVEERVAHPGVLPVHDPDPLAVVDEVGRQQVVVTGDHAAPPHGEPRSGARARAPANRSPEGGVRARSRSPHRPRPRGTSRSARRWEVRRAAV